MVSEDVPRLLINMELIGDFQIVFQEAVQESMVIDEEESLGDSVKSDLDNDLEISKMQDRGMRVI